MSFWTCIIVPLLLPEYLRSASAQYLCQLVCLLMARISLEFLGADLRMSGHPVHECQHLSQVLTRWHDFCGTRLCTVCRQTHYKWHFEQLPVLDHNGNSQTYGCAAGIIAGLCTLLMRPARVFALGRRLKNLDSAAFS